MASFKYKNMQRFVRCTMHPFLVNLRDILESYYDYIMELLAAIHKELEALGDRITRLDNKVNQHYQEVINRLDDARWMGSTKFVGTSSPSSSLGINGDVYFQLI